MESSSSLTIFSQEMEPMELDQDHHEMTQTELSHIILTILIILHITKQILLDLLE